MRTGNQSFRHVTREADAAVSDDANVQAFDAFNRISDSSDLWHTTTGHNPGGTDRARANTDFDGISTGFS